MHTDVNALFANLWQDYVAVTPSAKKVHQLLGLFGCEYREGRAESAPLLRPHDHADREGGHPIDDPLPTFAIEPHNPDLLPHLHDVTDIEKLFPSIAAAPEPANSNDYETCGVSRKDQPESQQRRASPYHFRKDGSRIVCNIPGRSTS